MKNTINTIKILKKGVKNSNGNYYPCFFNKGTRTKWEDGKHVGFYNAITIYAKSICKGLPKELFPQNEHNLSEHAQDLLNL